MISLERVYHIRSWWERSIQTQMYRERRGTKGLYSTLHWTLNITAASLRWHVSKVSSQLRGKGPKTSFNQQGKPTNWRKFNKSRPKPTHCYYSSVCSEGPGEGGDTETLDTKQRERGSADRARAQPSPASLLGQGWVADSAHWLWPLSLAAAPSYHWMEGGSRETLVITYRITTNNNHRQEDILSECDHLPVWEGSAWDAVSGVQAVNSDHLLRSGEKPGICGQ